MESGFGRGGLRSRITRYFYRTLTPRAGSGSGPGDTAARHLSAFPIPIPRAAWVAPPPRSGVRVGPGDRRAPTCVWVAAVAVWNPRRDERYSGHCFTNTPFTTLAEAHHRTILAREMELSRRLRSGVAAPVAGEARVRRRSPRFVPNLSVGKLKVEIRPCRHARQRRACRIRVGAATPFCCCPLLGELHQVFRLP